MGDGSRRRRWPRLLAIGGVCLLVVAGGVLAYAWNRGWLTATYLAASRDCGELEPSSEVVAPPGGGLATLTPAASGLLEPTDLAFHPYLDLGYLSERAGAVRVVRGGVVDPEPILDLADDLSTDGEQGLLALEVDPDGSHIYAYLNDSTEGMRVDALPLDDAGRPRAEGRRPIIGAPLPALYHNGGGLVFGPDGMLYVGVGDGGLVGDRYHFAQSTETLLGKVLRIEPRPDSPSEPPYAIPEGNPFVDQPGARPEIWVLGLRNPWRLAFAPDGRMWLPDLGHRCMEEVNLLPPGRAAAGANLGWNLYEGTREFLGGELPERVQPVFEYPHQDGWCAVIGGVIVRDPDLAHLAGAYLVGDFCSGGLVALTMASDGTVTARELGVKQALITAISEDRDGGIWVLTRFNGVYRLDPPGGPVVVGG